MYSTFYVLNFCLSQFRPTQTRGSRCTPERPRPARPAPYPCARVLSSLSRRGVRVQSTTPAQQTSSEHVADFQWSSFAMSSFPMACALRTSRYGNKRPPCRSLATVLACVELGANCVARQQRTRQSVLSGLALRCS